MSEQTENTNIHFDYKRIAERLDQLKELEKLYETNPEKFEETPGDTMVGRWMFKLPKTGKIVRLKEPHENT